jgi:hypothetical protein
MTDDELKAVKAQTEKLAAAFMASCESKKPCTVILTTDGEHYRISQSSHPLPVSHLEGWQEETRKFDEDLFL